MKIIDLKGVEVDPKEDQVATVAFVGGATPGEKILKLDDSGFPPEEAVYRGANYKRLGIAMPDGKSVIFIYYPESQGENPAPVIARMLRAYCQFES